MLPLGAEDGLIGQIDVVGQQVLVLDAHDDVQTLPVAPDMSRGGQRALAGLTEALTELDEEIADLFLREQEVAPFALRAARRLRAASCW